MHEQYGIKPLLLVRIRFYADMDPSCPIVRINPHEVHCSDSPFIDDIYAVGSRKRDEHLHQILGSGA